MSKLIIPNTQNTNQNEVTPMFSHQKRNQHRHPTTGLTNLLKYYSYSFHIAVG